MNISVIGSSQSIDILNADFVQNCNDFFELKSSYPMSSVLSMMSEPLDYNFSNLKKARFNDYQMEHWYYELEKPILRELESIQPDIILMDFYTDARYGVRSYGGEYLVDRLSKLKNKDVIRWDRFGIVYNYKTNTDDYITMWKNRFDRFMDFMTEHLPQTHIIINTIKGTNIITDKSGNSFISPQTLDLDIEQINGLWKVFDDYAIKKYNLRAITFDKEYTLDPEYQYGLGVALVHFHKAYYKDCFKELVNVTSDLREITQKESHVNLVVDSAYKKELDNWTNFAGDFKLVKYSGYYAVKPINSISKLGNYRPQMWSKAIRIDGDGKVSYTLSFYIKIKILNRVKPEDIIFAMRTFEQVQGVKSAEAIEEYKLTLESHTLREDKEYRYVYTFTPKGKYIRLAPFMFKYVSGVEYSRIKLERSSKVSDYTM